MTKPFFRIPVSALAAASFFLLGTGPTLAADDDPAKQAAAEKLVAAMHTEQLVNGNLDRLLGFVDQLDQRVLQGQTLKPEQTDEIRKAKDEARDTIRKELGYDAVKGEFVNAYAETFSDQELKDLTNFYSSPVGQKMVDQQPKITEKVGRAAQQKMATVMPGVVQKLREVIQKNLPPPPAPEPGTPPAGGPVPPPPAPPANDAAPAPPKAPVPPAPPVTVTTPPVSANPAPPVPTPLPTASAAPTPAVQ